MTDSWQTRNWEGWGSVLACLLVTVESDSWCENPTALWAGEGDGWEAARSLFRACSYTRSIRVNTKPKSYLQYQQLIM